MFYLATRGVEADAVCRVYVMASVVWYLFVYIKRRARAVHRMILDLLFDDKRIAITFMMCWLVVVLFGFSTIGLMSSNFMHIGPSENTKLMSLTIDTWHDWIMVASASFLSAIVNDFFSDSLGPWFLNTVQDQKTRYLPYSKSTCFVILQLYSIYCAFMSVFSVGLLMSQIDFLLVRLSADLLVNTYTTFKFLRGKEVNRRKYEEESNHVILTQPADDSKRILEMTDVLSDENDDKTPLNGTPRG